MAAEGKKRKMLSSIMVLVGTFLMLTVFWNGALFASDEEEIFLKGRAIAQGLHLYTEIGSQHMPVMYYIAAFFALFGVETVASFRLCFYLVMAVLWALCYYRYSDKFGGLALVLFPVIYIILLTYVEMGHTILSEQFVGIGMAILLFELLAFRKERELKIGNCMMISLAIFISFGSAFVAIFSVFAVGLTVLCLEIRECHQNKVGIGNGCLYLVRKYWKLIIIVALPFAVMLTYYAATNSLRAFYGWAYKLNREIYPKYLSGYGNSILSSLFAGIEYFATELSFSTINATVLSKVCVIFGTVLFMIHQHKENGDFAFTCGLTFFLITAATRGLYNHHGLGALALVAAMNAIYINGKFPDINKFFSSVPRTGVLVFVALVFAAPYLRRVTNVFEVDLDSDLTKSVQADSIDALTEPGERIGFGMLNYDVLMKADVIPASVTSGSCPWMWEWGGQQSMDELQANPPRVFYFERNLATWGYQITDYAPELVAFVDENYTSLNGLGYGNVYVRNDYYAEAIQLLDMEFVLYFGDNEDVAVLQNGMTVSQMFEATETVNISSFSVMVGTYARENDCDLVVLFSDETTGEEIVSTSIDCMTIQDNEYLEIAFDSYELKEGHSYKIVFSSPDATEDNFIAIYHTADNASEEYYAAIGENEQQYNLCVKIMEDE